MPAAKTASSAFSPIVLGHLALIALVVAYNTLRYFGTGALRDVAELMEWKADLQDWVDR